MYVSALSNSPSTLSPHFSGHSMHSGTGITYGYPIASNISPELFSSSHPMHSGFGSMSFSPYAHGIQNFVDPHRAATTYGFNPLGWSQGHSGSFSPSSFSPSSFATSFSPSSFSHSSFSPSSFSTSFSPSSFSPTSFSTSCSPFTSPISWGSAPFSTSGMTQPRVDIAETNSDVVITAELPNINSNDLYLTVTSDSLSISCNSFAGGSHSSVHRTIALPTSVQSERAEASYSNGILEARLPKSDVTSRRRIKVNPSTNS